MGIKNEKLAFIVPTKDRHKDLRNFLESVTRQEILPSRIIVIDGGDEPCEYLLKDFGSLDFDYRRHIPPSLTEQRNKGIGLLKDDIEILAFFDDDIVLKTGTVKSVMDFFENSEHTAKGAACNNISHSRRKASPAEKIFLLGSDVPGMVLRSGFQGKICSVENNCKVQWLMGGATFWRKEVFNEFGFDEWYYGYAHCEDLDFSYRVSKKYDLYVIAKAECLHITKPVEAKYEYALGKMQVVNRMYFVKKNKELSKLLAYWAFTGLFIKNLILGIFLLKKRYLMRGLGVFSGMIRSPFALSRVKSAVKE